jgi:hypothetical protein
MSPDELKALGRVLRDLCIDPSARPQYDLMSDAVIWPDEVPIEENPSAWWDVRPIWHLRTRIVLGLETSPPALWIDARREFPSWIGFLPERSEPTPTLRETYERIMKQGRAGWPCLHQEP